MVIGRIRDSPVLISGKEKEDKPVLITQTGDSPVLISGKEREDSPILISQTVPYLSGGEER